MYDALCSLSNHDLTCTLPHSVQLNAFRPGFRFYYWPYYANSSIERNGYTESELYIERPKYDQFKTEMMEHHSKDTQIWTDDTIHRVEQLMKTERIRRLKVGGHSYSYQGDSKSHYGLHRGDPISFRHVMALVIYHDFKEIAVKLSESMTLSDPFESMHSVKARNSAFYHLSKYMREAVELYGDSAATNDAMKGPFFVGLPSVMVIPGFAVHFNAPTVVTKDVDIALGFATVHGMVLQIDNEHHGGGYDQMFFDLSCLSGSDSLETLESPSDLKLTIGGHNPLQLKSVNIPGKAQSFERYLEALFWMDCVLSGQRLRGMSDSKMMHFWREIVWDLMAYYRHSDEDTQSMRDKYDSYILDMFDLFCVRKRALQIDMDSIDRNANGQNTLGDILFRGLRHSEHLEALGKIKDQSDVNVLSWHVLDIFPNLKRIDLRSTDHFGQRFYPFSLKKFCDVLGNIKSFHNGSLREIVITGTTKKGFNPYSDVVSAESSPRGSWLQQAFSKQQIKAFSILYTISPNRFGGYNDRLTITPEHGV